MPLRDGDVLAVWRLDRLGRSMPHLIETIGALEARGVGFRSLTEAIDTTTPGGRLIFHVFGALGQFERDLIRERTKAGLTAAAARGRKGGRKPVVTAENWQLSTRTCWLVMQICQCCFNSILVGMFTAMLMSEKYQNCRSLLPLVM